MPEPARTQSHDGERSHPTARFSPGSILIFPGDQPADSIRRELRGADLELIEPEDADDAVGLLEAIDPDLILIEPAVRIGAIADALRFLQSRRIEPAPILVLAGYGLRPLEAKVLYELGVTDVVFPPHHPNLTLARIGALLRLKRRLDAAREASVRDELTGLYNRRFFFERLEQEVARTMRTGVSLSLILFDIDLFKKVNDTFGHPVGDSLLRAIASIANRHTRKSDLLARMGGDEFALLLSANDAEGARICAEGLRRKVATADLGLPSDLRVTASFGVAAYPHPLVQHPMKDLVREADLALLAAKDRGRNCVATANAALLRE